MTFNDPHPQISRWTSHKRYEMLTPLQWNTYTRPTQRCHFEWPSATLTDLAKYSVTWSIAQSFCDGWVSCIELLPTNISRVVRNSLWVWEQSMRPTVWTFVDNHLSPNRIVAPCNTRSVPIDTNSLLDRLRISPTIILYLFQGR